MAVARFGIDRLFVGDDHSIFFPLFVIEVGMNPVDDGSYLCLPFRKILGMLHHKPGAGHGIDLGLAPFADVFKKRPPPVIAYRVLFEPGQYFIHGGFIGRRFSLL